MVWSVLTLTWLLCLGGEGFQHPAGGGGCHGWVLRRVLVSGSPAAPAAVSIPRGQQCPAGCALLHMQKKGSPRAVLPSGHIQRSAGHAWETSLFPAGRAASRARTLLVKNCDFSSLQLAKRSALRSVPVQGGESKEMRSLCPLGWEQEETPASDTCTSIQRVCVKCILKRNPKL